MKPYEITSSTNSQFKIFKSLLTSKGIKEEKLFILSGQKLIEEFLISKNPRFQAEYLLFQDEVKIKTDAKITRLSNDLFKELDVLGTHFNLLVLSYSNIPEKIITESAQGLEIICPLGDPRNLGSLFRTALGFGAREVILTAESTHPFLPQCLKASAGAALEIQISKCSSSISEIPLIESNYALELHGTSLEKIKWPKNLRLWVGEEGPGLRLNHEQKKRMSFIHIPTQNVESLNASVSTALALWEWKKNQLN